MLPVAVITILIPRSIRGRPGRSCGAALYDFVQLATIEPDAPAGGTIVDLDSLPLGHHQSGPVHRPANRPSALLIAHRTTPLVQREAVWAGKGVQVVVDLGVRGCFKNKKNREEI